MVEKNNGNVNPETPQQDSSEEIIVTEQVEEKTETNEAVESTDSVDQKSEEKSDEKVEEKAEEKIDEKTEKEPVAEAVAVEEVVEEKTEPKAAAKSKVDEEPVKTEVEEQVVNIKELKAESEYSEDEYKFLSQMYDKTLNKIKQGDIVKGKVLDITDNEVIVDIGFKSEGIVPIEEFDKRNDVAIGDEVEVYLESLEDMNGQLILSRRRADFIRVWENVVEKHEKDETISGTIVRRIKGGMVVSLNGVDAFLPGSQIDVKPIRDFDSYLGKEQEFKIVKVNHARRNIVVSSRVLIEKEMESQRSEIIDTIEKGQVRPGTVKEHY